MARVAGIAGYSENASRFRELNESIDLRENHGCPLPLLPKPDATVLDVGAGTGRDAAVRAAMGHSLVAVEPIDQFLAEARARHPSPRIHWVSGSLSELRELSAEPDQFDFVLCHAVWQHLNDREREGAMARLAGLLKPTGVLTLELGYGRPGAGPDYFPAGPTATIALAPTANLTVQLYLERQPSALPNKTRVTWTRLAFRKTTVLAPRPPSNLVHRDVPKGDTS